MQLVVIQSKSIDICKWTFKSLYGQQVDQCIELIGSTDITVTRAII